MPNFEFLAPITAFLVAVTGLLKVIVEVRKLKPGTKYLKYLVMIASTKYFKYLVVIATQIVPVGTVIWCFMYWAAENSSRLSEPVIFLLLVGEPTTLISAYEFIWGMWFLPKLKLSPAKRESPNAPPPPISQPSVSSKQKSNIESSSGEEYQ